MRAPFLSPNPAASSGYPDVNLHITGTLHEGCRVVDLTVAARHLGESSPFRVARQLGQQGPLPRDFKPRNQPLSADDVPTPSSRPGRLPLPCIVMSYATRRRSLRLLRLVRSRSPQLRRCCLGLRIQASIRSESQHGLGVTTRAHADPG